jgi:hypothetical protein
MAVVPGMAVIRLISGAWDGCGRFTCSWLWLELLTVAGMALVPGMAVVRINNGAWDGFGKIY